MLKNYGRLLLIISIIFLFAFGSCVSGYMPVESANKWTGRGDTIKLKSCSIIIYTDTDIQKDTAHSSMILIVDDIAAGRQLAISNLKVALADYPASQQEYVLQKVTLRNQSYSDTVSHAEYVTDSMLRNGKIINVANRVQYIFHYSFVNTSLKHYSRKMQVSVEAKINDNDKLEAVNKAFVFKRYRGVDIAGN